MICHICNKMILDSVLTPIPLHGVDVGNGLMSHGICSGNWWFELGEEHLIPQYQREMISYSLKEKYS